MDEMKIQYLVKHNFKIVVSFDGPKEIHDKYRRFANNGRGTYDLVMENVKFIQEMYPEYFKTQISFSTVLNPEEGYSCIGEYFNGEEIFQDAVFTANIISDLGIKDSEKKNPAEEFIEEYKYEYFKLLMSKLGWVQEKNVSIIARNQFSFMQRMRGGKQQDNSVELPKKWHHGGPCVPGERSLFLNVDGLLYPCEKVCEKAELAVMGDIWNGIDTDKASRILNVERNTEVECKQCWAYRYCDFCVRYAEAEQDKFRANMLEQCEKMRQQVESIFKDYCVFRELGYDFEYGERKRKREGI